MPRLINGPLTSAMALAAQTWCFLNCMGGREYIAPIPAMSVMSPPKNG